MDIERYNFWNLEMERLEEEQRREWENKVRRWDLVSNKIPFCLTYKEKKNKDKNREDSNSKKMEMASLIINA